MLKLFEGQCECGYKGDLWVDQPADTPLKPYYECPSCGEVSCKVVPAFGSLKMSRSVSGRTKDGTKWELVSAGPIDKEAKDITKPDKRFN